MSKKALPRHGTIQRKILDLVVKNPGITTAQLAGELKFRISCGTVNEHMRHLRDDGWAQSVRTRSMHTATPDAVIRYRKEEIDVE